MLSRLVAVIAKMIDGHVRPPDCQAMLRSEGFDGADLGLVNPARKADVGMAAEQTVLPVAGEAGFWPELHHRRRPARTVDLTPQRHARRHTETFIRVDVENPVTSAIVEAEIPGAGEVARPLGAQHARTFLFGYPDGAVGRSRVGDDDFVDLPAQGP